MSYLDFKEVTSENTGTSLRYGGNDLREIMKILNGKVVPDRRPKILNEWIFLDHFDLAAPGSNPSAPADADTNRVFTDTSDKRLKIKKTGGSTVDLENVNIANSALIQITDKAKLHSALLYNDVDNTLGSHFLNIVEIAPPATPAANSARIYLDNADEVLKIKKSTGTVVNLESGGAGSGDVATTSSNTYGDFDQIFRSGRLDVRNPANTFSYSITGSAIVADRTWTLPLLTGNDLAVGEAHTQTLTNKTVNVDANTVKHSTTNAAGDILKGDGTKLQRLARGTANQVLQVNAGGTDVAWATIAAGGNVSTTSSNTYGDFDQIFRSTRVKIRNPADTFSYNFTAAAIAADRTITLPLLTGNDVLATEAFTTTLTNKTLGTGTVANTDTITLKHSTTNAAGELMKNSGTKFDRFAKGSALQVLRTNSGATDIEWATLDNERVGKSTANGNGSTTVFNIAHGLGSNPTYAFVSVGQSGTTNTQIARSYTTDATNIVVTFAAAPSSGTNNVVIYWRVVA